MSYSGLLPVCTTLQERPPTCTLTASWACWRGKRPEREAPSLTLVPTDYSQGTSPHGPTDPCHPPSPPTLHPPIPSFAGRTWSPPRSRTPKAAKRAVWVRESPLGGRKGRPGPWVVHGPIHPGVCRVKAGCPEPGKNVAFWENGNGERVTLSCPYPLPQRRAPAPGAPSCVGRWRPLWSCFSGTSP